VDNTFVSKNRKETDSKSKNIDESEDDELKEEILPLGRLNVKCRMHIP